jgi:hypothetical protein
MGVQLACTPHWDRTAREKKRGLITLGGLTHTPIALRWELILIRTERRVRSICPDLQVPSILCIKR